MIRRVVNFFDKFEDVIREHLSRYPIVYTVIGAVAVVLFWRGIWHTADILQSQGGILGILLYEPVTVFITTIVLLATGLFVSYFIGDSILLSGAKSQKKLAEKTSKELRDEEITLVEIKDAVDSIKSEVHDLKRQVQNEHKDHMRHVVHEREKKIEQFTQK